VRIDSKTDFDKVKVEILTELAMIPAAAQSGKGI